MTTLTLQAEAPWWAHARLWISGPGRPKPHHRTMDQPALSQGMKPVEDDVFHRLYELYSGGSGGRRERARQTLADTRALSSEAVNALRRFRYYAAKYPDRSARDCEYAVARDLGQMVADVQILIQRGVWAEAMGWAA